MFHRGRKFFLRQDVFSPVFLGEKSFFKHFLSFCGITVFKSLFFPFFEFFTCFFNSIIFIFIFFFLQRRFASARCTSSACTLRSQRFFSFNVCFLNFLSIFVWRFFQFLSVFSKGFFFSNRFSRRGFFSIGFFFFFCKKVFLFEKFVYQSFFRMVLCSLFFHVFAFF